MVRGSVLIARGGDGDKGLLAETPAPGVELKGRLEPRVVFKPHPLVNQIVVMVDIVLGNRVRKGDVGVFGPEVTTAEHLPHQAPVSMDSPREIGEVQVVGETETQAAL